MNYTEISRIENPVLWAAIPAECLPVVKAIVSLAHADGQLEAVREAIEQNMETLDQQDKILKGDS